MGRRFYNTHIYMSVGSLKELANTEVDEIVPVYVFHRFVYKFCTLVPSLSYYMARAKAPKYLTNKHVLVACTPQLPLPITCSYLLTVPSQNIARIYTYIYSISFLSVISAFQTRTYYLHKIFPPPTLCSNATNIYNSQHSTGVNF